MDSYFTHLHCHSNFSLLNGAATVDNLIDSALKHGMKALALTDINNISASVDFFEKAELRGLKPIIGAEISMKDGTPMVVLVKDSTGYENLCEILTTTHVRSGHSKFLCTLKDIIRYKTGLVLLSGGNRGAISQLVADRQIEKAGKLARKLRDVFGSDFYIELNAIDERDSLLNLRLSDLAQAFAIPSVATNDVFYCRPQDASIRNVLRAIGERKTISSLSDPDNGGRYLCSDEKMAQKFSRYPNAIKNAKIIADQCNFKLKLGRPVFPALELAEGETAYSQLWKVSLEGLHKRYKPVTQKAVKRLEYELNIIHSKGFTEYFLIAKEIVEYCKTENIPCVGRGSAADSLVSYLLEITDADPLRFNLYFERFLNPERSEPPDIDIDICWKRRDQVLDFIYNRFGHDKTAIICTFSTFQLRSAVGDIGKAFGLPENEVRGLTKTLPHRSVEYLSVALKNIPECKDHPIMHTAYKDIVRISSELAGYPRHLSVHPGGVIIAPDKITRYTALQESAKGLITSQHNMYGIEKLGLVKMDILGVRGLSVISDTLMLCQINGRETFPENDVEAMQMIMRGSTIGCFQLESPAMRGLLRKLQVQTIEDVIASIAIIRPGPAEGGMKDAFVRRRAGVEKTEYPHPMLEPVLKETFGIVVYQEQVLQVANTIAAFSFAEADLLRRGMTKARTKETLLPLKNKFILGTVKNGVSSKSAEKIWQFLQNFVGYGFNKAHSATYGLLAYKSAYLKCKHPVEFMASVMNNGGGFYSISAYVEEARRMKITIVPPDVTKSVHLFRPEKNSIISGLLPIEFNSRRVSEKILSEREKSLFTDLLDFLQRVALSEREALSLAKSGALRTLHRSEPESITIIKMFYKNRRKTAVVRRLIENLSIPAYTLSQRLVAELETMKYCPTAHPLSLFANEEMREGTTSTTELHKFKDMEVTILGWIVTSRRAPSKNGGYLKFITVEDRHGLIETVMFSDVYNKYGKLMRGYGPFKIQGVVQSRVKGEENLIISKVSKVSNLLENGQQIFDREIEESEFHDQLYAI